MLDRTLLVHCTTAQVNRSVPVADRPGGGLVISPDRGDLVGLLTQARYLLQMRHFTRPVLLDAARYAGTNRLPARAPFDPRWLRRQRELDLPVLTDSGYVDPGDDAGLVSILRRTAGMPDAIALLPLHVAWLRDERRRAVLLTHVRAAGVPVALVLEYRGDPFALVGVAAGVVALLACEVPVLVLRSDLSALGALCCGAVAGAIGTIGSLRHLYPLPYTPARPVPRPAHPAAVFRPVLSYRRVSAIARARRRPAPGGPAPDDPLWCCDCDTCGGRPLDWLAAETGARQEVDAFQHSMRVAYTLRDELLSGDLATAPASWRARCAAAASRQAQLGWGRAGMLDRWQEVIPGQSASRPASVGVKPQASR